MSRNPLRTSYLSLTTLLTATQWPTGSVPFAARLAAFSPSCLLQVRPTGSTAICEASRLRDRWVGWVSLAGAPTLWLLRVGSSDPKSEPRDNLFRPHRVYSYSIVGRVNGPKEALPKSTGPFAKRSPAHNIEDLPPRTTCARVLRPANPRKNDNPQKDNQTWTQEPPGESASEIHAIAVASRPPASTKNRVAPRPSSLAQLHPRNDL